MFHPIHAAALPRQAAALACSLLSASLGAQAQISSLGIQALCREVRQQARPVDAVRLAAPKPDHKRLPGSEAPCFRIGRLSLAGERAEEFQWASAAIDGPNNDDSPIGRRLCIDLFVATPIAKPEGYRTPKVTGGVNLNFSF